MGGDRQLTLRGVAGFWLPLAAMWVMMGLQQPGIAAIITRLPEPKVSLAAFGIAFSLAILVESPVIMLLAAATAIAGHPIAYRRLLRFTHVLAAGLTLVHLVLALPPVFSLVVGKLIGAPLAVVGPAQVSFLLMLPWTPAIAYRRLWDGLLIRHNHPRLVSLGTGIRLVSIFGLAALGLVWGRVNGAYVGAVALSVGVIVSALASYFFARHAVWPDHFDQSPRDPLPPAARSWRALVNFYVPLALTSVIALAGQPLLNMGLSRAAAPLSSLAIWPVLMGLTFLIRSVCIAYQEVAIALLKDAHSYRILQRFTLLLTTATTAVFLLIVFTPLADVWFQSISGLPPDLAQMARLPAMVLTPAPALTAWQSWQRSRLVLQNRTSVISQAVGVNVLVLVLVMGVGIALTSWPGSVVAASAYTAALALENVYLWERLAVSRPSIQPA